MRRLLLCSVSIAMLVSTWGAQHTHAAGAARTTSFQARSTVPDPCGYRYAVWTTVQQLQNFAQHVEASGTSDSATILKRYSYLDFKVTYLAEDYGDPPGWKQLSDADYTLAHAAVTGGSLTAPLSAMWAAVNNICSWKGKAATSPGVLNAYGNRLSDTNSFRVPANWHVRAVFDCGSASDEFMLVLYSAAGQQIDITEDHIRKSGWDSYRYKRGGSFYFRVITTCDWHVNVHA